MNQTNIPYAIIAVKEPILQNSPKDNSPPYVTYLVTGKDPHGIFNMRRRFREFDILRIKLVERFIGLYIPSIPSKKIAVDYHLSRAILKSALLKIDKSILTCSAKKLQRDPFFSTQISSRPSSEEIRILNE